MCMCMEVDVKELDLSLRCIWFFTVSLDILASLNTGSCTVCLFQYAWGTIFKDIMWFTDKEVR